MVLSVCPVAGDSLTMEAIERAMSYDLHSADSPVSVHKTGCHRLTFRRVLYLAWLMFLATAIYAFPLYGALYPAEGTWFDSEQFWFSLCVVAGWPVAAFFLIRWQWRLMEDPLAHCEHCGREIPETSIQCPTCMKSENPNLTTERMGALMLTQRSAGNA